ncbi:MAG: MFS transporter [Alphaproteobacteria bacterium]|nr:MFS transporter [Alphaproteobacteria bacterium]
MPSRGHWTASSRLRFVLLFGAVNLFADMTYEGARSIIGLYMAGLGASGLAVGAVSGSGELLGYTLRLVSGRWADRTRLYWPTTLAGYVVQMVAVPALALAGTWPHAAVLILAERTGRATRTPPRDVMLADAGEQMGRGWAFGLNEALDQLGALIGPLAVAAILFVWRDAHSAFGALAVPGFITLVLVCGLCVAYPSAGRAPPDAATVADWAYPPAFWWYLAAGSLVAFGFADYSLIAYHYTKAALVPHPWIPVFYALAMGAGGAGAPVLGKLFDRRGLIVLVPLTVLVAAYAPLAFSDDVGLAVAGALLWGLGLGAHESVMQAAVAQMVPQQRLGSAYGLFGAVFGIAWFLGSAVLGALYDVSIPTCAAVATLAELLAIAPLLMAARHSTSH